MKKLIITLLLIVPFLGKAQRSITHGIGLHMGFYRQSELRSYGGDYEIGFINNADKPKGYLLGIAASFAPSEKRVGSKDYIADQRRYAIYLNPGYRYSILSGGASIGMRAQRGESTLDTERLSMLGIWAGIQPANWLKLTIAGDNFNTVKIGTLFYPNRIKGNK